jgi:ribosomal protein S18 acetylase RimI-like enzyme
MPDTLTVRTATQADEPALLAIDAESWTTASTFPSVLAKTGTQPFFDAGHPPENHVVAELDGAVVGYARLQPPTPLPESSHVLAVNGLAVSPSARGRGIAPALLAAAEQRARDNGASKLSLRVLATNHAARRVYDRAGFVVEAVLRGEFRIDGTDVDDVLMARYLDGTPPALGDQR